MKRGPDAATLLVRRLLASALAAGCPMTLDELESVRWASATFTGARHRIQLRGPDGAASSDWEAGLAEAELPIAGHLVADLSVVRVTRQDGEVRLWVEALTVEEG